MEKNSRQTQRHGRKFRSFGTCVNCIRYDREEVAALMGAMLGSVSYGGVSMVVDAAYTAGVFFEKPSYEALKEMFPRMACSRSTYYDNLGSRFPEGQLRPIVEMFKSRERDNVG